MEQLNRNNGLLGRPVEYILLDDQAKPDITRSLYERLISGDKVDLIVGAFGTPSNLAVHSVAQRYGKVVISNTLTIPKLATYPLHFPTQGVSFEPDQSLMNLLLDSLATTPNPPKSIAVVGSKFPAIQFISQGAREVALKRGLSVPLYLEYEFGTRDFGPVAARIKEANADFVWVGALGVEGIGLAQAMKKIEYTPKGHLYLFPAAGAMANVPELNNALSFSGFEQHPPFTDRPGVAEFVKTFNERAAKAGFPYTRVEHQAAVAYAMWQVLEAAVTGAKSLDDKAIAQWLKANRVETILGTQRFDGQNNYGADLHKVVQLQSGRWLAVYPKEMTAPGAKFIYSSR